MFTLNPAELINLNLVTELSVKAKRKPNYNIIPETIYIQESEHLW